MLEIWIMHWLEIILIGIALSMDALAVSLALGTSEGPRMDSSKILLVALFFGGFQALMPLAGWFGCSLCGDAVVRYGRYISAGLLGVIGGKMIFDREPEKPVSFGLLRLLVLAFATSIDAFLVGVGFACLGRTSIGPEVIVIGCITFAISAAGCVAGRYSRRWFGKYSAPAGGAVLIAIGLKTLFFG